MDFISIGNLSIALKWIILGTALLMSFLILGIQKKDINQSLILGGITNSLFTGFIILKLSLIFIEPKLIFNNPLTLLYFTGGKVGFWLAVIIASAAFFWEASKKKISTQNSLSAFIIFSFSTVSIYHLIFLIVYPGWEHLLILLIAISVLLVWFLKNKRIQMINNFTIIVVILGMIVWAVNDHHVKKRMTTNNVVMEKMDRIKDIEKGEKAVDFALKTLDGKDAKLSDYKGKKVILNFWATWCPPCKAEMPYMEEFYKENNNYNVVILAVNLTSGEGNVNKVKKFSEEYGLTFPILLDTQGEVEKVYQAFTIPTSYFIYSNGTVQQKVVGPMSKETMETLIFNIN